MVGSPCWACRASSVWIEEISAPNSRSPHVDRVGGHAEELQVGEPGLQGEGQLQRDRVASLAADMSSNRWRTAITIQSLV